jgi:hypothetical protein
MKCSGGDGWREIAFGSDAREGTAFGSTWDALGLGGAIAKWCLCVAALSSSSSVHRVQLKGNIIILKKS